MLGGDALWSKTPDTEKGHCLAALVSLGLEEGPQGLGPRPLKRHASPCAGGSEGVAR